MKKILFLFLILASVNILYSQEIITDRPDKTESVETVGKGKFQIEMGMEYTSFSFGNSLGYIDTTLVTLTNLKSRNLTLPTTLIRYGILKNVELRFAFDFDKQSYNDDRFEGGELGLNPPRVGAKIHLYDGKEYLPAIAFIGSVSIPQLGAKDKKTDYLNPEFLFAFSNDINDDLSLGYNLGIEHSYDDKATNLFYSVSLGIGLTPKLGAFAELYGNFPNDDYLSDQNIDGGFTYLINNNLQIDVYGGIGLSTVSNNFMLGTGIAYKFN